MSFRFRIFREVNATVGNTALLIPGEKIFIFTDEAR
jgi:hypothetical protein